MSQYTVYEYKGCSTCRKAMKFLDQKNVKYTPVAIREKPPSKNELKQMLEFLEGDIKKLLNTSGQDYRAMNLKEKLPNLSLSEVLELLTKNGNLVKRPFVLGKNWGTVGFKEEIWKKHF